MKHKTNTTFWKHKKVLITGHTGFKGSWLSLVLGLFKSELFGFSLKAKKISLFNQANIKLMFKKNIYSDLKNKNKLKKLIFENKPDFIFHFASQALVNFSYKNPKKNFETNVLGLFNLLEILRNYKKKITVIIATSDKCYQDQKNFKRYNENSNLGGIDPYSSSKAVQEILSTSYYHSFFKKNNINLCTVRAGNVIGGGDWTPSRIIPDYMLSYKKKTKLSIRYPNSIRPWQHILDVINGYLILAEKVFKNKKYCGPWNFGPNQKGEVSVIKLVNQLNNNFDRKSKISLSNKKNKETKVLKLDSSKARKFIKWKSYLNYPKNLNITSLWYLKYFKNHNAKEITNEQIKKFFYETK